MTHCRIASLALILVLLFAFAGGAAAQDTQRKILDFYGYFSTRFEKTINEPGFSGGQIVKESSPGSWTYPSLNLMAQGQINDQFRVFLNFNGGGGGTISVQNYWGEYSPSRAFKVRLGKIYRKFGLYNEILDAVPTYYGIEPPELFDPDHLIVSRTTTAMVLGGFDVGKGVLNYSFTTDSGEGDPFSGAFPFGYDFNYRSGTGTYTLGISGYNSFGPTNSDVALGDGSPKSGVLPWMAEDRFSIVGGYGEVNVKGLTLQSEYWFSSHDATRDPSKTVTMILGSNPNAAQMARFLINPAGSVTESNVRTNGSYDVKTAYVRGGYSIESKIGEFGPYFQWDWYSNPETIGKKKFGGDNEAGVSDNGRFIKWTAGLIFRPRPEVAVKFDASTHRYIMGGQHVSYPEVRLDISYVFGR